MIVCKIDPEDLRRIASDVVKKRKDKNMNIRISGEDLRLIRQRAKRLGIKYQTFVSEIMHHVAHSREEN